MIVEALYFGLQNELLGQDWDETRRESLERFAVTVVDASVCRASFANQPSLAAESTVAPGSIYCAE